MLESAGHESMLGKPSETCRGENALRPMFEFVESFNCHAIADQPDDRICVEHQQPVVV
jgi:hypothetical protein